MCFGGGPNISPPPPPPAPPEAPQLQLKKQPTNAQQRKRLRTKEGQSGLRIDLNTGPPVSGGGLVIPGRKREAAAA
jgi:hypothetical protein